MITWHKAQNIIFISTAYICDIGHYHDVCSAKKSYNNVGLVNKQ